jgi:hypothetical protein
MVESKVLSSAQLPGLISCTPPATIDELHGALLQNLSRTHMVAAQEIGLELEGVRLVRRLGRRTLPG